MVRRAPGTAAVQKKRVTLAHARRAGRPNFPGVYTRVPDYFDWLCQYVAAEGCGEARFSDHSEMRLSPKVGPNASRANWTDALLVRGSVSPTRDTPLYSPIVGGDAFLDVIAPRSRTSSGTGRIINGDTSVYADNWHIGASDMPFFTGLADASGTVYCGATMVSRRHLVTAAHCIKPYLSKALIGRRDQSPCLLPGCYEGVIDAYIQHEQYSGSQTLRNDIALLRIRTTAPESFHTRLASRKAVAEATSFVIAGMGATSEAGDYPAVLQMASVPAVPEVLCASSPVGSYIADGMLCAGMLLPRMPPSPPPPTPPLLPHFPASNSTDLVDTKRATAYQGSELTLGAEVRGCDWFSERPECLATVTLHDIPINDAKCELRVNKPVTALWIAGWNSEVDFDMGEDIESTDLHTKMCLPNWYGAQVFDNTTAYVQVLRTCLGENETVILPANASLLAVSRESGYSCAETLALRLNCSLEEGELLDHTLRLPASRVEGGYFNETSNQVETVFYRLSCYTFSHPSPPPDPALPPVSPVSPPFTPHHPLPPVQANGPAPISPPSYYPSTPPSEESPSLSAALIIIIVFLAVAMSLGSVAATVAAARMWTALFQEKLASDKARLLRPKINR